MHGLLTPDVRHALQLAETVGLASMVGAGLLGALWAWTD